MISTVCDIGMIFLCNDKNNIGDNNYYNGTNHSRHNYLIYGINNNINKESLGFIQAMGITSMKGKTIGMEVPIRLCNNLISYVVPYNLHSFSRSDIEIRNYKGCIVDTPTISKTDFLSLLMDIYTDSLGFGNHEAVLKRYQEYCKNFWNEFKNCQEFRNQDVYKLQPVVKNTELASHLFSNENTIQKRDTVSNNTFIQPKKSRDIPGKNKKIHAQKKYDKREEQAINRQLREGRYDLIDDEIEDVDIVEVSSESVELKPISNSRGWFKLNIDSMKKFNNTPRLIREWEDNDILEFMHGYKQFGYAKMHSVILDRWSSSSAMAVFYSLCKKEANSRGLDINSTIDPLTRPMPDWSDEELKHYLVIMTNHKYDTQFQLSFTGFDNIKQCQQLTYRVKKEMTKRNIKFA